MFSAKINIGGEHVDGIIRDICDKGCRCVISFDKGETAPLVKIKDSIKLIFGLPWKEKESEYKGKIRNIKRDEKEMQLGIEFNNVILNIEKDLINYKSGIKIK